MKEKKKKLLAINAVRKILHRKSRTDKSEELGRSQENGRRQEATMLNLPFASELPCQLPRPLELYSIASKEFFYLEMVQRGKECRKEREGGREGEKGNRNLTICKVRKGIIREAVVENRLKDFPAQSKVRIESKISREDGR